MKIEGQSISVRKTILVGAPASHVFSVFTERLDAWWPRKHHIGKSEQFKALLEPKPGGRWYERGSDGSECDWGKVLAWEPPARIVLSWNINAQWQYDPSFRTEVEVRFIADAADRTRVELEHRGLEQYGEAANTMRAIFESPEGWAGTLEALRSEAELRR